MKTCPTNRAKQALQKILADWTCKPPGLHLLVCTVYSVQYTVYSIQYTVYSIQCKYSVQCIVYSVHCVYSGTQTFIFQLKVLEGCVVHHIPLNPSYTLLPSLVQTSLVPTIECRRRGVGGRGLVSHMTLFTLTHSLSLTLTHYKTHYKAHYKEHIGNLYGECASRHINTHRVGHRQVISRSSQGRLLVLHIV